MVPLKPIQAPRAGLSPSVSALGRVGPRGVAFRSTLPRTASVTDSSSISLWNGSDDYTPLGDRRDLQPLPLPGLTAAKRITIVRHGQSTWNAEGRIQV